MKTAKEMITIPRETTVTFLKNPEVSFVSLVRHGANNTPFRVIKSNKGEPMNKIVQAIRVLKDSKADLETLVGKDFRKDTIVEDGNYLIYEQVDKSVCNPDTKAIVVLDPANHVYAVTYELLVEGGQAANTVAKSSDNPLPNSVVLHENLKEVDYWDVFNEMYAMSDLISGSMGQSTRTSEDRKAIVLSAIDNFKAFCEAVFEDVKSVEPFPVGKGIENVLKLIETFQKQVSVKKQITGGETMFELESKEVLVGIIAETVDSVLTKKAMDDAKSVEAKEKLAKEAKITEDREKEITDLKALVADLTAKVETLSGTVVSKTIVDDPDPNKKVAKENVYSGMFSNLRSTPGGISAQ